MSQGFVVNVNGKLQTVQPFTPVVEKQGRKQFWFYLGHKPLLAVQDRRIKYKYSA